jgi:hypothetical protein
VHGGFVPIDLSLYEHGSIKAAFAAAKAAVTAPAARQPTLGQDDAPPVEDLAGHRTLVRTGTA